jgi:hypothetical protein
MNYAIEYSILEAPDRTFGVVSGEVSLPNAPSINQPIDSSECEQGADIPFAVKRLKVRGISQTNGLSKIVFEDVVVESHEAAAALAMTLETKFGLFCWRLHDD